jgi:hypothetical protein
MRELDRLYESYGDLLRHLDPAAASAAGSVSGDGRLGRFDDESVREHVVALKATASAIEELEVEALDDEIDRTALLDELRATVARWEEDRPHRHNPALWIDHLAQALTSLLLRPDHADAPGHRAYAAEQRIAAIPGFLDAARATLARPPLVLVDGALAELGSIGQALAYAAAELGPEAPGGPDALGAAVTGALQALAGFGHWLRSEVEPDAGMGGALGEARFDRRIHHRYAVPAGAGKLWGYATRLLDETDAALAAEARALDPARSWRDLVARFDDESVPAVAGIDAGLEQVRAALSGGAVPILPGPMPVVTAPLLRGVLSEIAYLPPFDPPTAGTTARLILPADRLSRFTVPAVAAAALAGRHLQESAARRLDSGVRRSLRTPIALNGWALYAEQWMADIGLFTAGHERLARLARLLRAAGLLAADVGIHARDMPASEAVALLTGRAALRRDEAHIAVRRILAHPAEAGAAALGRREILALRATAEVRVDDRAALERFHTTLLGFGALPPGLAGWGMGLAS